MAHGAAEALAKRLLEMLFVAETAQFADPPDGGGRLAEDGADALQPVRSDGVADGRAGDGLEVFLQQPQ